MSAEDFRWKSPEQRCPRTDDPEFTGACGAVAICRVSILEDGPVAEVRCETMLVEGQLDTRDISKPCLDPGQYPDIEAHREATLLAYDIQEGEAARRFLPCFEEATATFGTASLTGRQACGYSSADDVHCLVTFEADGTRANIPGVPYGRMVCVADAERRGDKGALEAVRQLLIEEHGIEDEWY